MESVPPNDDIYSIVIECSLLFDHLTVPKISSGTHSKTPDSSGKASQTGSQHESFLGDPKSTPKSQIKYGGEDEEKRRAKMEIFRESFELWINYTGALAAVGRSLDDRLRNHVDIKEMVVELLQMLTRNLQHIYTAETIVSNIPQSPALTDNQILEKEAWMASEQAIEDLHFMAAAIRRSSTQSEKYNLSSSFDRDDDLYFEEWAKLLVKREFPHARRSLCEQLGVSIAVRRKRLFRRKLHEEKLGGRRQVAPVGPRPPQPVVGPRVSLSQADTKPSSLPLRRLKKEDNHHMRSNDTRSTLDSVAARNYIGRGPSFSTISMGSSVRDSTIQYPEVPGIPKDSKFCACPYCAKPLEAEILKKDPKYWKDHIDADVKPYVCLSEECTTPLLFFVHMSEWLDHMKAVHSDQWARKIHMTTWYCDIDHENESFQFNDYPSFVNHIKDPIEHSKRPLPTDQQLDTLSRNKQKVLVREEEFSCPLCDCVPNSIEPVITTNSSSDIKHQLSKHVAEHIKVLAFISVPIWTSNNPDQKTISDADAENEDRRRLRRDSSSASNPSGFDSDIRAVSLSFLEDPQLPYLDTIEDDFSILDTGESNWDEIHSSDYHIREISGVDPQIPDTSESYLDDIGFNDYKIREVLEEGEDSLLAHFSRLQHPTSIPSSQIPLIDQIEEAYQVSVFDDVSREFLPDNCVTELITYASILRELDIKDASREKDLIDFILRYAKRIFAITLVSGISGNDLLTVMRDFKYNNFQDESLPIKKDTLSELLPLASRPLPKRTTLRFLNNQWIFLAPVFSKTKFQLNLEPEHILPFIRVNSEVKDGMFSQVVQAEIQNSHLEDPIITAGGHKSIVAIKETIDVRSSNELQEKVNKEWEREAEALYNINDLNHPNIIQCIAAITRGREHYFIFPWADGGNLRDFWQSLPRPSLDGDFVKEIVQQLRGLADALNEMYHPEDWYCNGDLKPENILMFKDHTRVGILKISYTGLEKHHAVSITRRQSVIRKYGIAKYESPWIIDRKLGPRSCLWSMGCITLELIVWLLYGYEELEKFNESIRDFSKEPSPYFEVAIEDGTRVVKVHRIVQAYMDHISKDPECTGITALGDLLKIVKTKLLVVLPPHRISLSLDEEAGDTSTTHEDVTNFFFDLYRATPGEFRNLLDDMIEKGEKNKHYWFTNTTRYGLQGSHLVPPIDSRDRLLSPSSTPRFVESREEKSIIAPPIQLAPSQILDASQIWEFPVDNEFANSLLNDMEISETFDRKSSAAHLCSQCRNLEFWAPDFRIQDVLSELEERSRSCDFCKMRWELCKHLDREEVIEFDRLGSVLRMNERYPPVFSICRGPNPNMPNPMAPIQIGFPELPPVDSDMHSNILRGWLKHCDNNHPKCRPSNIVPLPARLIYVGDYRGSTTINLYETKPGDSIRYLALSHQWGNPPYFFTRQSSLEEYKERIEFSKLPTTFQNAIFITRGLGFQYIWIDSICLIYDEIRVHGGNNIVGKRVDGIFSSAYCVLSASSAKAQSDGFLKIRDQREYLTFIREGQPPFYVCRFIDDFNKDVLKSSLNTRGWVLQERALARRTIYFTDRQTYWECGGGVRCETLTKTHNTMASFLGDPNFPEVAAQFFRRGFIRLYQDIYRQYSRLHFTRIQDRPIAIAGLEKRLISSFNCLGGFGIFSDEQNLSLLSASLLWHRGFDETNLDRIIFPPVEEIIPPTWSWMAYKGGIDYLDFPLDGVDWEEHGIRLIRYDSLQTWHTGGQTAFSELSAVARYFDSSAPVEHWQASNIIYDSPARVDRLDWQVMCVVVGRLKNFGQPEVNWMHYVLFVAMMRKQLYGDEEICERIGVGCIPGQWVKLNPTGIPVRIC